MTGKLLRITARHLCAGVIVGERTAPILGYMREWTELRIRDYCRRQGWRVEWAP